MSWTHAWGRGSSDDELGQAIGYVGLVCAVGLFLAPIPTFVDICRSKSVKSYSGFPYIVSLLQCMVWVVYCLPFVTPGRTEPLITNGSGAILEGIYCFIFIWHSNTLGGRRAKVMKHLLSAVTVFTLFVALVFIVTPHVTFKPLVPGDSEITDILGVICVALNIAMYASPLSVMVQVVQTKSVRFMPMPLTVGTLLCSTSWAAYATWVGDVFIAIPNFCGVVLGLCQMVLYCYFCKPSQPPDPRGESNDLWEPLNLNGELGRSEI